MSRSSTTCPSSIPDSPESPVFLDNGSKEEKGERQSGEKWVGVLSHGIHMLSFLLVLGGFESRPFIRGLQGRSVSMRAPTKTKDTLNKVLPLRWSFGSKDRRKPAPVPPAAEDPTPAELVQYLESGRRPRCTKDSILTLMAEPHSTKEVVEGQAAGSSRSSSVGRISCVGKAQDQLHSGSPQVPEGQRRPSHRTGSLRQSRSTKTKEEATTSNISSSFSSNTLSRRKEARNQSLSVQDPSGGVQASLSTPSIQDGTLRRPKERSDKEHQAAHEGNSKLKKGEMPRSHEVLLSFFRGSFLRKDKDARKAKEGESEGEAGGRRTLPRSSQSNGTAVGRGGPEGIKYTGHLGQELSNGKVGQPTSDIKRSQSSSNIPTKTEQTMRRTASLHRNGMSTTHPPRHSLTADKPSYATLQRTRYSTTSLGRKRTVPESSF